MQKQTKHNIPTTKLLWESVRKDRAGDNFAVESKSRFFERMNKSDNPWYEPPQRKTHIIEMWERKEMTKIHGNSKTYKINLALQSVDNPQRKRMLNSQSGHKQRYNRLPNIHHQLPSHCSTSIWWWIQDLMKCAKIYLSTRLKDNKVLPIRTAQDQRLYEGSYLLSLNTMEINDPQAASPETINIVLNILRWQ